MKHKDSSEIPWRGIPSKDIEWYPKVIKESYIGCGLCFLTCGRDVYDFDFEKQKPVVAHPYNCVVGCNTWGMICL